MAFTVIEPTPGLDAKKRRRARLDGPVAVAVRTSYPSLLESAGFRDVEAVDVTKEYFATQRRTIDAFLSHETDLRSVYGDETYEEKRRMQEQSIRATDDGILSRSLYSCVRR